MKRENRKLKRLEIDRGLRVRVHIFPVMPFIGESVDAGLINLSVGGMALVIEKTPESRKIVRDTKIRVHFRLPGGPLRECVGVVRHAMKINESYDLIGLRFLTISADLTRLFAQMISDSDRCDTRLLLHDDPSCEAHCAFRSLCRKPIRSADEESEFPHELEIVLQAAD